MKHIFTPVFAIACYLICFFPSLLCAQYEILAGQTTGDSVHYVDVDPDMNKSSGCSYFGSDYEVDFDINNDGTLDLKFYGYGTCQGNSWDEGTMVSGYSGTEIAASPIGQEVDTLNLNDSIHGGLTWSNGGALEYSWGMFGSGGGLWHGVTDKYLAFRINVNGDFFYGWFRLDLSYGSNFGSGTLTIKDYAWRGDGTAVGLENIPAAAGVLLYPNPAGDLLRLDFEGLGEAHELSLFNAKGQRMTSLQPASLRGTTQVELDLRSYPAGMYIVRLEGQNGSFSKRFMKR